MTPSILLLIVLISLISGFLATLVLRLATYIEGRVTGRVETYEFVMAYCKITKQEFVLLDDVKKNRLNLIIGFIYNSIWGLLIPILLFILVPKNIIGATATTAFLYLSMIMFVYFVLIHFANLLLYAFYFNKESPFWKWEINRNLIEALKRLIYAVAGISFYLLASYIFVYIIA